MKIPPTPSTQPIKPPTLERRLAALEAEHARDRARIERLERAFVSLAEFTHPGVGGPTLRLQQVVLTLLAEIRADLAEIDRERGRK